MGVAKAALEVVGALSRQRSRPEEHPRQRDLGRPDQDARRRPASRGFSSILQVYRDGRRSGATSSSAKWPMPRCFCWARVARHHRRSGDGRRRLPRHRHLGCSPHGPAEAGHDVRRRSSAFRRTMEGSHDFRRVRLHAWFDRRPRPRVRCSSLPAGKTVGETIDDATITARVKTALLNDPQVGGTENRCRHHASASSRCRGSSSRGARNSAPFDDRARHPGVKDVKSTLQLEAASRNEPHSPTLRSGPRRLDAELREQPRHFVDERRRPADEAQRVRVVDERAQARPADAGRARPSRRRPPSRVTVCRRSMSPGAASARNSCFEREFVRRARAVEQADCRRCGMRQRVAQHGAQRRDPGAAGDEHEAPFLRVGRET